MTLEPTVAKHAAESGHWYDRTGEQIETVPSARGDKLVKVTLRQARKLDLCRGVTSIIGASYRHDLEQWKIREGVKAALRIDRTRGLEHAPHYEDQAYLAEILEASKQVTRDTADEGSRIHAAIQSHFQGEPILHGYEQHVAGVVRALTSAIGSRNWQSEVSAVSRLGYGTKIDLLAPDWILDTKSKDGDEAALQAMRPFDSYTMQLAAGDAAEQSWDMEPQGSAPRRAGIVYVSRTHPGVAVHKEIPAAELERGWEMFRALLRFTFARDNYRPSWTQVP